MTQHPEQEQGLDLDALVQRARIESQRTDDGAGAVVLRLLAEAGGTLPAATLIAQGAPRETIAGLVDTSAAKDKRVRPKVRLGVIGNEPVIWLTATGWQATGRASGREMVPTADSIGHATAPAGLAAFLSDQADLLNASGIVVRVVTGPACRRWSEELVGGAWARVRTNTDPSGAVGSLTGGLIPDALVVENWRGPQASANWQTAWGAEPDSDDDLAETTAATEVEWALKSQDPLRGKVERLDAAINLRACRAVVWVVRSRDVWDRLSDLGVGDVTRRPWQLLVPARLVGLDGDPLPNPVRLWWPIRTRWAAKPPQTSQGP